MAKSLEVRFNGNREEVLRDTEHFGYFYAMDKWHVKDYMAIRKWAADKADDPHFGEHPKLGPSHGEDLGEQILNAMLSYISRSDKQREQMKKRIEMLEWQLGDKSHKNREKVIPFLEACRA